MSHGGGGYKSITYYLNGPFRQKEEEVEVIFLEYKSQGLQGIKRLE